MLFLSSCTKFLEQPSPDEFKPSTVADLQKILMYEGYPVPNRSFHPYASLLDDDIKCIGRDEGASNWRQGKPAFTWSKKMYSEMQLNGDNDPDTYGKYYQRIKGCNVILDNVQLVKGRQAEKDQLEGEAIALRAYYYFMLINLYGWPFNDSLHTPDKALGVPLVLSGKVADACLHRNTVLQVYNQVVSDITRGCLLLEKSDREPNVFSMNKYAAWLLASRIFLYMENWDNVMMYNDKLLAARFQLENMRFWASISNRDTADKSQECYINPFNKEILFLYGCVDEYSLLGLSRFNATPRYCASDALNASYEKGDLRADVYLNAWKTTGEFSKVNYKAHLGKSFRLPEAYLNRAEACIRKYIQQGDGALLQKAVADLNHLRQYRFSSKTFVPETAAGYYNNPQQLLQLCLGERRRELCFEEQRWFDLRRLGMPAITHFYYTDENKKPVAYQLPEKSNSYVLPIPDMALVNNPLLEPNP
ncbi:SusD-like starch-binding protein associating with outer membrane [Chitinophaga niastensis]|uniref:SusD-like starch-binding protein associating with outer membrane n=2 Tax=Chitinophaga niastensis TaxID=536980 RepID=A0A2P8HA05_CHINA|nr:SusD-like starch-binding protein associating with outer membrane [Chitinophaga niastensis]